MSKLADYFNQKSTLFGDGLPGPVLVVGILFLIAPIFGVLSLIALLAVWTVWFLFKHMPRRMPAIRLPRLRRPPPRPPPLPPPEAPKSPCKAARVAKLKSTYEEAVRLIEELPLDDDEKQGMRYEALEQLKSNATRVLQEGA